MYTTPPDTPEPENQRVKSLAEFHRRVNGASYRNPEWGRQQIRAFIPERHTYTGSADSWFNLCAEAGRLDFREERFQITEAGLREHPDNLDLLCDQLQGCYGVLNQPQQAQDIWTRLEQLDESKYYWRYWTFGAIYHGRMLRNREKALELLDTGLCYVSSDHINNIIRAYRNILIDYPPSQTIRNQEERERVEKEAFIKMEGLYKWAISLGVEDGYSLAISLATLYQERAESKLVNQQGQGELLQQALHYLDLAEKMFTGNTNHPIWEIYLPKARIYMGQRRYADALNFFSVLPAVVYQNNPSYDPQRRLAARMVGEVLDAAAVASIQPTSLVELLEQDAEKVFRELMELTKSNNNIREILIQILQQTAQSEQGAQ